MKIPVFDKENNNIWKTKIMLFIRASNQLNPCLLENAPFIPQKEIPSYTDDDRIVPAHWVAKKPIEWTDTEKDKVALEDHLQLNLLDSLSNEKVMCDNVITCISAFDMWRKIELLCEGSEEVRESQNQILVSQYEAFMAKSRRRADYHA